jgi:hypothetical protein
VIAQSPLPGFPITYHPDPHPTTVPELAETLGEEGARLLSNVITSRSFVEAESTYPLVHEDLLYLTDGKGLAKAPKIKKEDSRISWKTDSTADILRRVLVFGRVWDEEMHKHFFPHRQEVQVRVLYDQLKQLESPEVEKLHDIWHKTRQPDVGQPFFISSEMGKRVGMLTKDGGIVEILSCTAAGRTTSKTEKGYGIDLLVGWIENADK